MRSLAVFLNGQQVGILEQDEAAQISFTYGRDWLTSPHAIPLSRSLPLQAEPFVFKRARAFFAGVLPDHGPRQRIADCVGLLRDWSTRPAVDIPLFLDGLVFSATAEHSHVTLMRYQ